MTAINPKHTASEDIDTPRELLIAKLTRAAYDVALRHGIRGPFTDLELALWHELGEIMHREQDAALFGTAIGCKG